MRSLLPGKWSWSLFVALSLFVSHLLVSDSLFAQDDQKQTAPPNVILFLADDMGWRDLACYGNEFHETPNIDQLAADGIRFTDAYAACPVCSPTRASILTGNYPATINLTDFIPGHYRPFAKLTVPEFNQQLPDTQETLAEIMKSANYQTGSFGKWHLGGQGSLPPDHGFTDWVVSGGRHFYPNFRTNPGRKIEDGTYLADFLTSEAERFLEENQDRPFFLYLPHYAVHIPLEAKKELIKKYEDKQKPAYGVNNPIYAAMVEHLDQSVGRLTQKLEELDLAENTIFIFYSDNGGLFKRFDGNGPDVMSNEPLRAEKGTLYEGGVRVPFIVRWPGKVQAGTESAAPVCSVDLLPTIVEMTGQSNQQKKQTDGVSLASLILKQEPLAERSLYWHYPHYHHCDPSGSIRSGRYKLIEDFQEGRLELYDLETDLGEIHNLAEEKPELAATMQQQLADWRAIVGANMPVKNPGWNPKRAEEWHRRPRK
ncbi:Arylsulfatase [Polystyrenella longa]|uniref:Arylsulfatase n=1 Tax=Polystyrenella longa TaxID=2528007 RepID=A0A518CPE7_9PLAN|nr:sulfatase [Polystyrenella longa]QDU81074.1 Arylsulfatase [Polystyrenella longa]